MGARGGGGDKKLRYMWVPAFGEGAKKYNLFFASTTGKLNKKKFRKTIKTNWIRSGVERKRKILKCFRELSVDICKFSRIMRPKKSNSYEHIVKKITQRVCKLQLHQIHDIQ